MPLILLSSTAFELQSLAIHTRCRPWLCTSVQRNRIITRSVASCSCLLEHYRTGALHHMSIDSCIHIWTAKTDSVSEHASTCIIPSKTAKYRNNETCRDVVLIIQLKASCFFTIESSRLGIEMKLCSSRFASTPNCCTFERKLTFLPMLAYCHCCKSFFSQSCKTCTRRLLQRSCTRLACSEQWRQSSYLLISSDATHSEAVSY